ncbi:hypothetical protein C8Q79DRAFT_1108573 [Trametes meyenii]|nr:hypothetical protein C8Q79DRAFT_1108573 [Trametes meyenii]
MSSRIAAIFILFALFPRHAAAQLTEAPSKSQAAAAMNGDKAGLAWANSNYNDVLHLEPGAYTTSIEFVPMLWGPQQAPDWDNNINRTIQQQHVTHLLGFNELDIAGQSNLTPAEAATLWKAHMEPLKGLGVRLGSPAISGGCTVDFVALHWYNINSTQFIEYLQDYHDTFQKPLWVTEWACHNFNDANEQCSLQDIVNLMNVTQQFMDNTDWVERYAWFGAMVNLQGVNQRHVMPSYSGLATSLPHQ